MVIMPNYYRQLGTAYTWVEFNVFPLEGVYFSLIYNPLSLQLRLTWLPFSYSHPLF